MKTKIYLLKATLLMLSLFGCNVDNDKDGKVYGYIPVSEISVIEENPLGTNSKISLEYIIRNSCEKFLQIYTLKRDSNSMNIAILGYRTQQKNCTNTEIKETKELIFKPSSVGKYTVRAWTGKNTDNTDIFKDITLEIANIK